MLDFIADMYSYSFTLSNIQNVISSCRCSNYENAISDWEKERDNVMSLCLSLTKMDSIKGTLLFDRLSQACQQLNDHKDYTRFADALEELLTPIYDFISSIADIDVTEGNYRLFSTSSGFLSLELLNYSKILHSRIDPLKEAKEYALSRYSPAKTSYCFLGCGLGYLPLIYFLKSDSSADIYIYHNDQTIIDYAMDYGVLSLISYDKLHIEVEKDSIKLLQNFTNRQSSSDMIGYEILPDVELSLGKKIKELAHNFFSMLNTRVLFAEQKSINYYKNRQNVFSNISELAKLHDTKCPWLVIAGGPSLDAHIELLKKEQSYYTIICASTVFEKLLNNDIRPNYVAVLDPQARTYGHFKNIDKEDVPLIIGATSNWRFSEYYPGPKYLVYSAHDLDEYKPEALDNRFELELGSTVSSLMINIAIYLGASEISLFGLDLSFPGGVSHASGTMDYKSVELQNCVYVESVDGKTVATTPQFKLYKSEIEKIIDSSKDVSFVNYSCNGVNISGAKWYKNT